MTQSHFLQVTQPLKELFRQDVFDDIPEIRLNPNSDIGLISSNIASLSFNSELIEESNPNMDVIFDAISEYLANSENIARVESLDRISKAFAVIIENSYTTLNSIITPTVDDIRKSIDERYAVLLTREKADSLLPVDNTSIVSESSYSFITWDGVDSPMQRQQVIDNACVNANLNQIQLSQMNLAYIRNKLKFAGVVNIQLPDDLHNQILSKLYAIFASNPTFSESLINRIFNIITNSEAYDRCMNEYIFKINDTKNIALSVLDVINFTYGFKTAAQNILQIISEDISPDAISTLQANIDTVMKSVTAMQYWLIYVKENNFKDSLIITENIINQPVYNEFVAEGKSIVDIYNYTKAFYFERQIPNYGISIEVVKSADTLDRLARASAKVQANAQFIKSKCLIAAYNHAISQFLTDEKYKEIFPSLTNKVFSHQFAVIASAKAVALAGDIANTDNVLYDLIISSFYDKSIIATLYKYLGTNFDDLTDNVDDDITDDKIIEVQATAIVEMLVDYLMSSVTVPVDKIEQSLECVY